MAHGDVESAASERSAYRSVDGGLVHDLERMIEQGGGVVVSRRIGRAVEDGTVYKILVVQPHEC